MEGGGEEDRQREALKWGVQDSGDSRKVHS